jgi:hypothetical protein
VHLLPRPLVLLLMWLTLLCQLLVRSSQQQHWMLHLLLLLMLLPLSLEKQARPSSILKS